MLLDTVAEPHYIKCVDLWGGQGVVVAAGQASGRISFVTFRRFDIFKSDKHACRVASNFILLKQIFL